MNKVAQIKPSAYDTKDNKKPIYYIICEGNRNPIGQTYNIESARMIRDQLEDLYIEWWTEAIGGKPLTNRYEIRVN